MRYRDKQTQGKKATQIFKVEHNQSIQPPYLSFVIIFVLFVVMPAFAMDSSHILQVPQKLADSPKDRPITFKNEHSQIQCLTPIFTQGEGYVGISDCKRAQNARYDVFSRIAWKHNDTWLCLSTANQTYKSAERLILRPCVLNDKTQSFIVKDNALYSPDSSFMVGLTNGFLTLQKTQNSHNKIPNLVLYNMQEWLDTIATPANLAQSGFIAWNFNTPQEFDLYYLTNNESIKNDVQELHFNLENGYIAQYNPANADMLCLTSQQTTQQSWNWTTWKKCNFHASQNNNDAKAWSLFMFADNDTAILQDYLGNFLRVTKYGVNWGVPYTAQQNFIAKDTGEGQTSYFQFNYDMQNWERFRNANLSDSLTTCPAKGALEQKSLPLSPLTLPRSFELNDAWIRRLWQIATTTDGVLERAGDCGVCLLHSYQMIAELNEYTYNPLDSGGFFFDTAYGVNPFTSFRTRYPILANELSRYRATNIPPVLSQTQAFEYAAQMYRAIALSLYPGHFWLSSEFAITNSSIRNALRDLFVQPAGTLWVVQMYFITQDGRRSGHAMPVLRTGTGVQFIPTNIRNMSYQDYVQALRNAFAHNPNEAFNVVTPGGRRLYMFYSLRLREIYPNPIAEFVSNNNCSGEGEDRRGSATIPLSTFINQCASGRCILQ
ncbi:DUF1561 family protein [Helicobacter sp. MIT 14-3879]|uniref:DUF1561 family protein n=1 Tax=Helicobacter sp. MIT 14-3879 TaxID=2040649 RepID=UPI0015F12E9A|nr:DUF1561 family protein [Helicobacter sp. MIT 14-3879]